MNPKHRLIPYREKDHGTPAEEWAPHDGAWGWWYITGYLQGLVDPEAVYFYQYTGIQQYMGGQELYIRMAAFHDYRRNHRIYEMDAGPVSDDIWANETEVVINKSRLNRGEDKLTVDVEGNDLKYSMELRPKKDPAWHADNGVLIMGFQDKPKERTVYYSYTSLETTGEITYKRDASTSVTLPVKGKSWLDRQFGPFENTFWHWFSLRFFDDEEIMLFAFPNQKYQDGTYVDKNGKVTTFSNYSYSIDRWVKLEDFPDTEPIGLGWAVTLPVKEKEYKIVPLSDDQFNRHPLGAYWEGLASIFNQEGKLVGYAVEEMLGASYEEGKQIA